MSLKDLTKYLQSHPVIRPLNRRNRTLIIVSDSKGSRLRDCVEDSHPENEIVWKCKGGRNSFQAANFVKENLRHFVGTYGQILLVVWTGTCDLTQFIQQYDYANKYSQSRTRRKRYIDLSNITISDIIWQYQEILSAAAVYGSSVQVVFLECPQYSVEIWNENQGHPNFEIFQSNTKILLEKIEELNKTIQEVNKSNHINAPKFGLDLVKSRKSNRAYTSAKVSFSLLEDGIHPDVVLSQYWLRRIVLNLLIPYCHD